MRRHIVRALFRRKIVLVRPVSWEGAIRAQGSATSLVETQYP
jgi:hypothetical protein